MIIILADAEKPSEHNKELTVNVNTFDCFEIRNVEGQFQLTVKKWFDGDFGNNSVILYILARLESYEQCYELFEKIMRAMAEGEKVIRITEYINRNQADLQNGDIPEV